MPPKSIKKMKPVVEPVIESVIEPVIEPVVEQVIEPVTEPVIEPVVEPVIEPVVEQVVEPVVESWRNSSTPLINITETHVQTPTTEAPVKSILDYDQDFYRHLDKTHFIQYSVDDLLKILSVRGYDNKNPALWAGARRLMQQLNCEQIIKEKKPSKKQPPPYIRNAPFREQRQEAQKEHKQEVREQRQERKEKKSHHVSERPFQKNNERPSQQPIERSSYQMSERSFSGFTRNKTKYNRNKNSEETL